MSNIVVDTEKLKNYGTTLDEKAKSFSEIVSQMQNIISAVSGSWDGYDAQNFIANANAYLSNLKQVENALLQFGNCIKNCSANYSNRYSEFYSILG